MVPGHPPNTAPADCHRLHALRDKRKSAVRYCGPAVSVAQPDARGERAAFIRSAQCVGLRACGRRSGVRATAGGRAAADGRATHAHARSPYAQDRRVAAPGGSARRPAEGGEGNARSAPAGSGRAACQGAPGSAAARRTAIFNRGRWRRSSPGRWRCTNPARWRHRRLGRRRHAVGAGGGTVHGHDQTSHRCRARPEHPRIAAARTDGQSIRKRGRAALRPAGPRHPHSRHRQPKSDSTASPRSPGYAT